MKFQAIERPDAARVGALARRSPHNPFFTPAYVRARSSARGGLPYLLGVYDGPKLLAGCIAFYDAHRWVRTLEIESWPTLAGSRTVFWQGLRAFCRRRKITELVINSYASETAEMPSFGIELARCGRTEHAIDLATSEPPKLSSQHRRNLKKAQKAGLEVRSASSDEAMRAHVELMTASLERRSERGEAVEFEKTAWRRNEAYLQAGAGEIFQARRDGEVVSSLLLLLAERGAYYHSAGTSAAGRSCGASPFLVDQTRRILQARGLAIFYLGGASPSEAGLYRFKSEFGGRQVALEAGRFYLGNVWVKKLRSLARDLRDDPLSVRKSVVSADRFVVYATAPGAIAPANAGRDTACRKLSDQDLRALPAEFAEQRERFARLGYNDAYAVVYKGQVAHVAWLVPPEHERLERYYNVALRAGEAEITHCLTAPKFRGLGLYPFAIRCLCQIAVRQHIKKIYMITNTAHKASRSGIEKAGLKPCGTILRVRYPWLPATSGPVIRTHRWPGLAARKSGGRSAGS